MTFVNQDPTKPTRTFSTRKAKLFRKDSWEWRYRVHEQLFPTVEKAVTAALENVSIEHLPQPDKKGRRAQNVELLKLCVKESPEYTRAFRHLGQELMLLEKDAEAVPYLYHYVEKTEEGPDQKSHVMTLIGMCLINQGGHYDDALAWLDRAAAVGPGRREPLFWAGRYISTLAQSEQQVARAIAYFQKALAIPDDGSPIGTTDFPEAWDDGLLKRSIEECKRGLLQLKGR
jgi:tetratricopeptide (TPR) repeat protein